MFHPSGAGYALAAKQLLPALCNALGELTDTAEPESPLESRTADLNTLLSRLGGVSRLWRRSTGAPEGARADRGARGLGSAIKPQLRSCHVRSRHCCDRTLADRPSRQGIAGRHAPRRPGRADGARRAGQGACAGPEGHRRPDHGLRRARRRGRLQHRPRGGGRAGVRLPARHNGEPVLLVVAADHPHGVSRDQGRRGQRVHLRGRGNRVAVPEGHIRRLAGQPQSAVRRCRGALGECRSGRRRVARPASGRPASRFLHRDGPDRGERRAVHRHQPRRPGPLGCAQPEPRRGGHEQRLLRSRDLAGDAAGRVEGQHG